MPALRLTPEARAFLSCFALSKADHQPLARFVRAFSFSGRTPSASGWRSHAFPTGEWRMTPSGSPSTASSASNRVPDELIALVLEDATPKTLMNSDEALPFIRRVKQLTGRYQVPYTNPYAQLISSKFRNSDFSQTLLWYARFKATVGDFPRGRVADLFPMAVLQRDPAAVACEVDPFGHGRRLQRHDRGIEGQMPVDGSPDGCLPFDRVLKARAPFDVHTSVSLRFSGGCSCGERFRTHKDPAVAVAAVRLAAVVWSLPHHLCRARRCRADRWPPHASLLPI